MVIAVVVAKGARARAKVGHHQEEARVVRQGHQTEEEARVVRKGRHREVVRKGHHREVVRVARKGRQTEEAKEAKALLIEVGVKEARGLLLAVVVV